MLADFGYNQWTFIHINHVPKCRTDGCSSWSERAVLCGIHIAHNLDRTVHIFVVDHADPLATIPYTWSTLFVNAITSDHFLCTYPKATLERKGYINSAAWQDVSFQAMQQCSTEGFKNRAWGSTQSDGSPTPGSSQYKVDELRLFRDSQALRFDLDVSTLLKCAPLVFFANTRVKLASWQYGVFPC